MLDFTHFLNRDILLKASAILFVSWSAVGADKLDEPKFDKSKAKKRLRTCLGGCVSGQSLVTVELKLG